MQYLILCLILFIGCSYANIHPVMQSRCNGYATNTRIQECITYTTIWSYFNLEPDRCIVNITGGRICNAENVYDNAKFLKKANQVLVDALTCMNTDYTQYAPVHIIMYDGDVNCPPIGLVSGCHYNPTSVGIPAREHLILADKFVALFHELGHAYGWHKHDITPSTHRQYCECEYKITGGVERDCQFIHKRR